MRIELRDGPWLAQLRADAGGAFTRLQWRGIDLLRPAPELGNTPASDAVRSTAAYPMLPWCSRIRAGQLRWDGHDYAIARNFPPGTLTHPHPLHGIGWLQRWTRTESSANAVRLGYLFDARGDAAARWPFAHRGWQRVSIDGDQVVLELGVTNESSSAMPAGLGWHPFFCIEAGARVSCPVERYWRAGGDRLPLGLEMLPAHWRFARDAQPAHELEIDHCFTGWTGRARLERPLRGLRVAIEASTLLRNVVLYRRAGADWLAIEPMSHMTDAFNRAERGEADSGTLRLAPGESARATVSIRCESR